MPERSIALYGTTAPRPEHVALKAGPVTATLDNGQLRWIKLGDVEVLRAVSFLIRDTGWATADPDLRDLTVDQRDDGFTVTFAAHIRTKDGTFAFDARIEGSGDGTVVFDAQATPAQDFTTNRTGFVVLHPLEGVVGQPVKVTYTDGHAEDSHFPDLIDPYQTFKHIRALSHQAVPGIWATCTMEGDTWEIEDHRNWTDASFKTYVKLLEWGYPYVIKAGELLHQTVTLSFDGDTGAVTASGAPKPVRIGLDSGAPATFPVVGISLPASRLDEAEVVAASVRAAGPEFLHCMIEASAHDPVDRLGAYKAAADAIGAPVALQVNVVEWDNARGDLEKIEAALEASGLAPQSIAVATGMPIIQSDPTDTKDEAAIAAIPGMARTIFGDITLGGGVFGFFTEFNRNTPPMADIDYVAHMSGGVIHAADDEAVLETIAAFPHIARSVAALSGGKPHWLGPSNIAMDTNPYGALVDNPDNIRTTMVRMDPRQRGLFGAAWTAGLVAEAARAGVARLITAAPAGELGMAYAKTDHAQPYFDGAEATVYPLFHVVAQACAASGGANLGATTSDPARVNVFAFRGDNGSVLIVANQTNATQQVALPDPFVRGKVAILDAASFERAVANPGFVTEAAQPNGGASLTLDAYAVAFVMVGT